MDLEGNIVSCNNSFEKILGYRQEESFRSYVPFVAANYLEMTRQFFQKAKEGTPQTYDTVGIHKRGHEVYLRVTRSACHPSSEG